MAGPDRSIAGSGDIDLTQRTPPDIATVADDPFGTLVKYGYTLFTDTANEIGPTVSDPTRRFAGNNLACQNCHLQGGTQPYAMPLIGVWGQFPQYRAREGMVDTLEDRINGCMERSMNGRPLPLGSREMRAFSSYMRWLSTGILTERALVGAGTLRIKEPARAPISAMARNFLPDMRGATLGWTGATRPNRRGVSVPTALGSRITTSGAGMSRLLTAAAYAMLHNMPIGTMFNAPVLTDEDAYDVAGYLISQKRPEKANLDQDFPVRLQKPIDAPYGPYVDGFSLEQHRYGPFGPIRAKVQELAAASRTEKAGEPDNGSGQSERAR
jgi:thiosulfate dehydrogenase